MDGSPVQSMLRRLGSRALRPLLVRFDEQQRLIESSAHTLDRRLEDSWHDRNVRTDELKTILSAEQRSALEAADVLMAGIHALRADVDALMEWGSPASVARLRQATVAEVDLMMAETLNRAREPGGLADQAGLWSHPALRVSWAPGRAWVSDVSARVVALPFVLGVLARLAAPGTVLDLANGDLALDVSIAAMGHQVVIAGRDRLPFDHPRLSLAANDWPEQEAQFDAVMLMAAEGFDEQPSGVDAGSLPRLKQLVRPGGLLALAVATADVPALKRASMTDLARALGGCDVVERRFARRRDQFTWDISSGDDTDGDDPDVLLVAATRSG